MISEVPKISVIVPCYKTENYLDRCIESIIGQTLQDIEVILVDDGSPDRVPAMCDEWAAKDARIKVIHQQNSGQGSARNAGLDIAKGEYVAFVDSDDWIDSDAYRAAFEEVERDNGIDVVFFGYYVENRWGNWERNSVRERMQRNGTAQVKEFLLERLACAPSCQTCGLDNFGIGEERIYVWHSIYKRGLIETHHIRFSTARVLQDMLWGAEFLLRCTKIVYIPDCYYHYCHNKGSVTNKFDIGKYNIIHDVHQALASLDSDPLYLQRIDRGLIDNTRMYVLALVASNYPFKIRELRKITEDSIWSEMRTHYKLSWLPLYPRIVLYLIYTGQLRPLYLWAKLVNFAKYLLKK